MQDKIKADPAVSRVEESLGITCCWSAHAEPYLHGTTNDADAETPVFVYVLTVNIVVAVS